MGNTRLPRFPKIYHQIIEGLIIFLIVFTPLAFGTRETWSIVIMEGIAFMAMATWLIRMIHKKEITFPRLWIHIPLAVLLGLTLFQLLPLPPRVLGLLSPGNSRIYKEAIPDWPTKPPFKTLEGTASELGIYIPAHEGLSSHKALSMQPLSTQNELLKFLTYLFLFYVVINNFKDRKALERLTTIIILMGLLLAIFGLVQHFTWNGKIYWFRELRYMGFPFGPFTNRNHFAGYMEMVVPLTLGSLVARTLHIDFPSKELGLKELVLAFFNREMAFVVFLYSAVIIMMLSLFFSLSRGGILSLLVGIIIFTSLMPKKKRLTPIFAILGVIFFFGVGQEVVVSRFLHVEPLGRYTYWKDSLGAIKDFPIFGSGLGTFPWIYRRYQSSEPDIFVDYAHNDYVQLFVEMGILGFLSGCVLCILYFFYVITLNRRRSTYTRAMACGGIASLGAILTHSMVDFNLHIPSNALLATLVAALTLCTVSTYERRGKSKTLLRFWRLPLEKRWAVMTSYGLTGIFLLFLLSLPIRNGLAGAYYRLREEHQNPSIQITLLQSASRLQPANSDYYRELGNFYILMGEKATALPFLMRAIYLKPTDAFLHIRLSVLLDSFFDLREVPPNYEPWERAVRYHIKASGLFFPIDPDINAESAKLLLKRWGQLDTIRRQEVLSIITKVLEFDNGRHSETLLKTLREASNDTSLLKDVLPKSHQRYESLRAIVERLERENRDE